MYHLFAHNGVDHGTAAEATTHTAGDVAWKVILVSVIVVAFMTVAVWAIKRLGTQAITNKDKEE